MADDLSPLVADVRLADDPALAAELAARWPAAGAPRPLSVTDLIDPRRAYWRRQRGPAPMTPERELRLELGRAWHRRLGDAVADEGQLEVRLRRGGISARVDLLSDRPVELKTGAARADTAPAGERPEYLEQLAAYCALLGRPDGRIVHVALSEAGPSVSSVDVSYGPVTELASALERREAGLRAAIAAGDPGPLSRCRWFGPTCEYRAAGLCDCTGNENVASDALNAPPVVVSENLEVRQRWSARLAQLAAPTVGDPERFRDGLYLRRTYFRRTVGGAAGEPSGSRPAAAPLDAYERALAALESGPAGELHRLPTGPHAPDDEVLGWHGAVCLVRGTRAHGRLSVDDVKSRFPQYLVELGFRAAASRLARGRLVVSYEASGPDRLPVQVFDVDLAGSLATFDRAWQERRAAVAAAIEHGEPYGLSACPAWMTKGCPYAASCRCATDAGRPQR